MVSSDRQGRKLDTKVFKEAISMFHGLSLYTDRFEPRFLGLSQSFVIDWSQRTAAEGSVSYFVEAAERLLQKETERCDLFGLDSSTRRDVVSLFDEHVIRQQVDFLSKSIHLQFCS